MTATATSTGLRGRLEEVVGQDHVRTDAGALVTFSTDATPLERGRPDAVVFPATADEVAGVLRIANERGVPVVPRGSGTNLSAGTVPHRGGIVLVLTRMNELKEVSDAELVAVCEPGVRTIELAQAAAAKGLLFPPDPGSQTTATIGGNVAECAGGLRALKYGVTRDYVLGVQAVLPTGEIIRSGGRLVKDVAGYDLRRLLCGSEGTLAVMTELTLRLVPAPEATGYPRRAVAIFATTVKQLRWAILTVCSVLALAYVMNLSGQTITLGLWIAGAGAAFAFLSPIVGWFGTAVTGSDTSANSLFGALQVAAAHQSHPSPTLLAAANSSGGVMGKMISPQNLAIGAAAVGLTGREGDIFRKVIGWSILLVLIMAVFVWLQSTSVLSWMVP